MNLDIGEIGDAGKIADMMYDNDPVSRIPWLRPSSTDRTSADKMKHGRCSWAIWFGSLLQYVVLYPTGAMLKIGFNWKTHRHRVTFQWLWFLGLCCTLLRSFRRHDVSSASFTRHSMAKVVYARLFDWLVWRINESH
jgi:hypothetical protein